MATIHDVAREAGVSRSTASRALAGYGVVSKDAAERVLAAAAELDYHANGVARSMKTGRSNTLGAVVADIENAFFARAMRGFTDVARANGFQVILTNTDEDPVVEQSAVRVFQERRVDGIVATPASLDTTGHLHAAHAAGVPIVLLDRRIPGLAVDVVQIDNVKAARETTEQLISAGHRKIAMLTGVTEIEVSVHATDLESGVSTTKDRLQGYRQALEAAGFVYRPDYVRTADFHLMSARQEAERLFRMRDRPTAVFTTDSTNALGVLLAVRDVGLHVPAGRFTRRVRRCRLGRRRRARAECHGATGSRDGPAVRQPSRVPHPWRRPATEAARVGNPVAGPGVGRATASPAAGCPSGLTTSRCRR